MAKKPTYEELEQKVKKLEKEAEERKRSEEILIYFRSAVESSSDAIGMSSPEGKHWYQNKGFNDLFGDIGTDPPASIYVDEKVGREIFKIIMAGDQWTGEVEMYGKEKKVLNIFLRAYSIKDDGKVIGLVGVHTDITERKLVKQALIGSEEKWRNILVNTPQIGIALDPQARIIFANTRFLKLTGWEEHEVMNQDWFNMFIPVNIREEVRKVFSTTMSQKDPLGFSTYENEIIAKTGELLNIAWSNVLTKDARGNVVDVTCLGIDLTERNKAEEALLESEKYYRAIFDQAGFGIVLIDAETGNRIDFNAKAHESHGYTRDEYMNLTSSDIDVIDSSENALERAKRIIEKGSEIFETKHRTKSGKIIDILTSSVAIKLNGRYCLLNLDYDNTARKKAEEALRENQERLSSFMNSASDCFYLLDSKLNDFVEINIKGLEIIGKSKKK